MDIPVNKDERIELRISSQEKKMFQKAQQLSGDRSFSSFIIRIVKKYSEELVAQNDRIIAGEEDRQKFFDAVFGESFPNETLREAAEKYKAQSL